MNKKLGILINTYNAESRIEKLVEGIYHSQQFNEQDINIYVYDDFSTDDTLIVLKQLQAKYSLRIIEGTANLGLLNARNAFLDYVNEDYIIFLDDDDALSQDFLIDFYNNYQKSDLMVLKRKFCYDDQEILHNEWYKNTNQKFLNFIVNTPATFITGIYIGREIYTNKNFYINSSFHINLYEDIPRYVTAVILANKPIYIQGYYLYNKKNKQSLLTAKQQTYNIENNIQLLKLFNNLSIFKKEETSIKNIKLIINIRLMFFLLQEYKFKINSTYKWLKNEYLNVNKKEIKEFEISSKDLAKYKIITKPVVRFIFNLFWAKKM